MVRMLIGFVIQLVANALGLIVASWVLDDVTISGTAFLVAVVIFTVVYAIAQPVFTMWAVNILALRVSSPCRHPGGLSPFRRRGLDQPPTCHGSRPSIIVAGVALPRRGCMDRRPDRLALRSARGSPTHRASRTALATHLAGGRAHPSRPGPDAHGTIATVSAEGSVAATGWRVSTCS
jgi:hypothetical protein